MKPDANVSRTVHNELKINFGGPLDKACLKHQPSYATSSGSTKELPLTHFDQLKELQAKKNTQ